MKLKHSLLALAFAAAVTPKTAHGQEDTARISMGFGLYDAFRAANIYDHNTSFSSPYYDARITGKKLDFFKSSDIKLLRGARPWAAIETTFDDSLWVGGGLMREWRVNDNVILGAHVGAGLYDQGDSRLDLTGEIEFNLKGSIERILSDGSRIGLEISHLSNADTASRNPGTETLSIRYSIPFN